MGIEGGAGGMEEGGAGGMEEGGAGGMEEGGAGGMEEGGAGGMEEGGAGEYLAATGEGRRGVDEGGASQCSILETAHELISVISAVKLKARSSLTSSSSPSKCSCLRASPP